jgi:hypothetical protein
MPLMPSYTVPYNVYPRDVTSPGPYQRPGVARSQTSPATCDDPQPLPKPQEPDPGDAPKPVPKPPKTQEWWPAPF